jgi:hypothetical protein
VHFSDYHRKNLKLWYGTHSVPGFTFIERECLELSTQLRGLHYKFVKQMNFKSHKDVKYFTYQPVCKIDISYLDPFEEVEAPEPLEGILVYVRRPSPIVKLVPE